MSKHLVTGMNEYMVYLLEHVTIKYLGIETGHGIEFCAEPIALTATDEVTITAHRIYLLTQRHCGKGVDGHHGRGKIEHDLINSYLILTGGFYALRFQAIPMGYFISCGEVVEKLRVIRHFASLLFSSEYNEAFHELPKRRLSLVAKES